MKELKQQLKNYKELVVSTKKELENKLNELTKVLHSVKFFDKFQMVKEDRDTIYQFKECDFKSPLKNYKNFKLISLWEILNKGDNNYYGANFHVNAETIFYGCEGYIISLVSKSDGVWLTFHNEFENRGEICMDVSEGEDGKKNGWKMVNPLFKISYEHVGNVDSFKNEILKVLKQNDLERKKFENKLASKLRTNAEKEKQKEINKKRKQLNKLKKELNEN